MRTKDNRYDQFGHANYAAVGSELRIDFDTIVAAQEYVHEKKYLFMASPEGISGEQIGYDYDQKAYNPEHSLQVSADMLP